MNLILHERHRKLFLFEISCVLKTYNHLKISYSNVIENKIRSFWRFRLWGNSHQEVRDFIGKTFIPITRTLSRKATTAADFLNSLKLLSMPRPDLLFLSALIVKMVFFQVFANGVLKKTSRDLSRKTVLECIRCSEDW